MTFHAYWDDLCDHLRDLPWEDIFKLSASAAASEFYEWVQVGIDVYIPHCKYQVKPHSSPWFSAAFAAAIVHRNHFFCFYQQTNLLNLKSSLDRLVIFCKRVLEATKLAYPTKTKESILSWKLGSWVFSTKVNLLYLKVNLLYSTGRRCCFLHLIKQNYLLKTFLRTLILMALLSLYLFSLLELI